MHAHNAMDMEQVFGVYGGVISHCTCLVSCFLFPFVGWCVRLPGGLVSPCLPLCPFLLPFVGRCVRLPKGLVSPCLLLHPFLFLVSLVGWCVRLPEGLVSLGLPCARSCFPLLDGVSSFPRSCFPWSPIVPLLASLCGMVCPPSRGSGLPLSPIVPILASLCGMVCPPSGLVSPCLPLCLLLLPEGLVSPCLLLHPFLFLVSLCWMVCPPSGLVSPCLPLPPFLFPFVGWCVRLPEVLFPWSPIVLLSPIVSTQVPALDNVLFPNSCLSLSPTVSCCFPLAPRMSHVCLCWMVCSPSQDLASLVSPCLPLSPIVSPWGPACVPVLDARRCVCVGPCLPLSPHMCACVGGLSVFLRSRLPLSPFLFPCVGWWVHLPEALSQLLSLSPSLSLFLFPIAADGSILIFSANGGSSCFLEVSALVLDGVSVFPRSSFPSYLSACFLWVGKCSSDSVC